jgi:hypothetical protein
MGTHRLFRRWTPRLLTATALALVPWMVLLGWTLPTTTRVQNWSLAWIGLDVVLAVACATTAFLDHRGDRRAGLTATATATIAVLDAWFDITTAQPGAPLVEALACALGEITLAGCCIRLALGDPADPTRRPR